MNAPEIPSLHRFDAYRLALDFRRVVVKWLPLKRAELSDQLDRASISICLNIAEGAGRTSPRERARHYTIARGSAVECLACLDLVELEMTVTSMPEARTTLLRLLMVLSGLLRRRL
jgi:four helix bundle protein